MNKLYVIPTGEQPAAVPVAENLHSHGQIAKQISHHCLTGWLVRNLLGHSMKDSSPHHLIWQGFWKGLGSYLAAALILWLAKDIGIMPGVVIRLAARLIPLEREAGTVSLILLSIGVLSIVIAYQIPIIKIKRLLADGTVKEMIGPHVPWDHKRGQSCHQGNNS